MPRAVFDSFAILAWLYGEPAKAYVSGLLDRVADGTLWGAVCSVNLGEVYYRVSRTRGSDVAEAYLHMLRQLPWQVLPATDDLVWAAARLKAQYPLSYADAFALACAQAHDAALVTNDPELVQTPHGTPVLWQTDAAAE
jgi:ribonuclease VapC